MTKRRIQIGVVDFPDLGESIVLNFMDLERAILLGPDEARNLAFYLMESADHLDPPFGTDDDEENLT